MFPEPRAAARSKRQTLGHSSVPSLRNESFPIGRRNFAKSCDAVQSRLRRQPPQNGLGRVLGAEGRMDERGRKLAVNGVIADFVRETYALGHQTPTASC